MNFLFWLISTLRLSAPFSDYDHVIKCKNLDLFLFLKKVNFRYYCILITEQLISHSDKVTSSCHLVQAKRHPGETHISAPPTLLLPGTVHLPPQLTSHERKYTVKSLYLIAPHQSHSHELIMRFATLFLSFASLAFAAELGIETTHKVECSRKTQNGDGVSMHYRGKLQDTGKEFDASYNRGTPLTFKLGTGRVIKG